MPPIAVFGSLVLGCTTVRMVVPPDVAQATELVPVEGRTLARGMFVNEDFKMGPYEVIHVSRGGTTKTLLGTVGTFKSDETSRYGFELKHGVESLKGEWVSNVSEIGVTIGSWKVSHPDEQLACACGNESSALAEIVLRPSSASPFGGTLRAHAATYEVKAIFEREGAPAGQSPSGFRVDGSEALGAVDVIGPGRVWLAESLDDEQKTDFACIFAGLLLFKQETR